MTKYYLILFLSTVSMLSVNGKIPDYIPVCKRNDPEIGKCIANSVNKLREKLAEGMPELDAMPIDPLRLPKVDLKLGPGFGVVLHNLAVVGAGKFQIHDISVDFDANTYSYDFSIPEIVADGIYDADAAIASIPIKGTGPFHLTAKSVTCKGTLHGKKARRAGKTFYWFPSMSLKFGLGDYNMTLENLADGDPTIGKVANKLLNEEKTEVLSSLIPSLEATLIEIALLDINNICKRFTWDELFPES